MESLNKGTRTLESVNSQSDLIQVHTKFVKDFLAFYRIIIDLIIQYKDLEIDGRVLLGRQQAGKGPQMVEQGDTGGGKTRCQTGPISYLLRSRKAPPGTSEQIQGSQWNRGQRLPGKGKNHV